MTDQQLPTEISGVNLGGDRDQITVVAENTLADIPPPELERYKISFDGYLENKCRVDVMDGKNAQIAIRIIKNIGVDYNSYENFMSKHGSFKLEVKPIANAAPYDEYYKGLSEDEEVKEIKYVDRHKDCDLRIFYYTLSKVFYVLAITAVHENLDHKPHTHKQKKRRVW